MIDRYWWPAAVGFVCQAVGIGLLGVYGFFVEPLAAQFDTGVAVINVGPVLMLIAPALAGPIVGRYVDTHSIRSIMLIGVALAAGSLLLLTQMPQLWMVAVCFTLFAFGMAMYGPVVLNSLLVKFYREGVARALAIAAMGVSLGSIAWPFFTAALIDNFSWQITLSVLAISLALGLGLSVRFGLPHHVEAAPAVDDEGGASDSDFLRTPAFWIIGVAASIFYNAALLSTICYAPHFNSLGFSNTDVATFLAAGGVAGMCGKLVVAAVADSWRRHIRWLAFVAALLMLAGYTLLTIADSFTLAVMATAMIGGAGGAFIPLHPFINSAYFSSDLIGRVNGAQAPLMLPLGLVAAPGAGYIFDTTGSYSAAFATVVGFIIVAVLLILIMPKQKRLS